MGDLVERYVHQVGRYLPKNERADIQEELRSLIGDQLDDRFAGTPSQADMAAVLAEFGDPRQIATSYNRERYLVGPDLYPYMVMVLRHVWVIVPTVVLFLNIFGALASSQEIAWLNLLVETLVAILQATFTFSGVAVMIFALVQRINTELEKNESTFNPLTLPKVDDPRTVDRSEAIIGSIFGSFVMLIFLYFLRVGGLTLHFDLSNPGDVIPVPTGWLLLFIVAGIAMIALNLVVLRRNRWSAALWLTETVLEVFGMICLYFVLYEPIVGSIMASSSSLADVPVIESLPEIIVIVTALITLLGRGSKLVGMWSYQNDAPSPFAIKSGG